MEFEAALAQEALGVFERTGLTPSQLADGLTECQEVRQSWVDAYVKMRNALCLALHDYELSSRSNCIPQWVVDALSAMEN